MSRITKERIRSILGPAPKPTAVWELQFDGNDENLRRIADCDWEDVREQDLRSYIHDLAYVKLQPDLFRHAFPSCLQFWQNSLLRNERAEKGDAELHFALQRGDILAKMMNDHERERLFAFFIDGFLDRIDGERDWAYEHPGSAQNAWIFRFNSLGLIAPVISRLWREWWAMETPGQAIAAIKYASGLIYFGYGNPVYSPWTPEQGGGGPYLAEWDAAIYDRGWLDENLDFLSQTLTCDYILEKVRLAADVLLGQPEAEIASLIADDARSRRDTISLRTSELLSELAKTKLDQGRWE